VSLIKNKNKNKNRNQRGKGNLLNLLYAKDANLENIKAIDILKL
jgi:hypothetical protein